MKDIKYTVYSWTCRNSKKTYVGYTGDGIQFRWGKHLLRASSGGNTYFDKALRKYPISNWIGKQLYETHDIEVAKAKEIEFIKTLNTLAPNGYNSTKGGTGGNTWFGQHVDERKKKLSLRNSSALNPNFSGVSDDDIFALAIKLWKLDENWIQSEWYNECRKLKFPLHLAMSRFTDYGGGLKGLKNKMLEFLIAEGYKVDKIKYRMTDKHRTAIGETNVGKIWVTNTETQHSFLATEPQLDGTTIIKGRNKC